MDLTNLFSPVILLISVFILVIFALRFNSRWERRLEANRILHGITLPLYHYLGLLDHEIQGEMEEIDNLFRQAVLDHVTELRAFLLQPRSQDLTLWGKVAWANHLNNLLLVMEETLEDDPHEIDTIELKGQVRDLLVFLQENSELSKLISRPLGVVNYSIS
jgi:hypothetical protein